MSPLRRLSLFAGAVAALALVAALLPLRSLLDQVGSMGPVGPMLGILLSAALLVVLVPRTPISMACGALFGGVVGAICALAAALIAATLTFAAGRRFGRAAVTGRAGTRLGRLEGWVSGHDPLSVAAVRALPLGPYGLMGYLYGTTDVRTRPYLLGTLLAATPSAISYAILGAAVTNPGGFNPLALIPLAFGLLATAAVLVRARRHRGDPSPSAAQPDPAAQPDSAAEPGGSGAVTAG